MNLQYLVRINDRQISTRLKKRLPMLKNVLLQTREISEAELDQTCVKKRGFIFRMECHSPKYN